MTHQPNHYNTISFPPVDYETWKKEAELSLKGKSINKLSKLTYENITLKPIYTKEDSEHISFKNEMPGFDTRVRGLRSTGYTKKSWFVSQEIDVQSITEFNEVMKDAISNGQSMIHFSLQRNSNSNNGLSLDSLENMNQAFEGISLANIPVFIDTHSQLVPFLTLVESYVKSVGTPLHLVTGTIGSDPIGSLVEHGKYPVKITEAYNNLAEAIKWAKENHSPLRTILVKGEPYHNGGANAVQELAYTLATVTEYITIFLDKGFTIEEISSRITFSFSVGSNVFMEIAKLRAAKILWSTLVEAFGGNVDSSSLHIHARTSAFTKTIYDPYVNMLRSTTEAFSAIIGGIDSLHVSTFDEPFAKSDTFSRRIARNTQSILKEESHLNRVIDPAGGSWYIESLTNELAEKAWELFKIVEAQGGIYKALKAGIIQDEIKQVWIKRQKNVNLRKDKIVGTNVYANIAETPNIGLQAQTSDLIGKYEEVIMKIPKFRHSESFEKLRNASEEYVRRNGERPKIGLINLGPIPEHKPRADFISGFFEAGGYQVIKNAGYLSVADAIEGTKTMNLSTIVICGKDDAYKEMASAICEELLRMNPEIKLYIAGKQEKEFEEELRNVGISDFIHSHTDCYSFLHQLQYEMGVLPNE
ncbi:methylmalonyl-CoA mutase subunit beta [Fredinandcohnia humi]